MNNLVNTMLFKIPLCHCITIVCIAFSFTLQGQNNSYDSGKTYILEDVSVSGNTSFNKNTIVTYSGLRKGKEINIPGEDIASAIKKLWNSKLLVILKFT